MVSQKPKYCKNIERNSHWRKLSMIMAWERYCNASPKPEFFVFFFYIFIHISANMSPFGLKFFSQMILHTETSKLMYNWSFLFVVLHKPTLLPSTFNLIWSRDLTTGCLNKTLTLLNSLPNKDCRTLSEIFHIYVWLIRLGRFILIYHMTPTNLKIVYAWVSTDHFCKEYEN